MTTNADIAVVEQAAAPAARRGLSARLMPLDGLRGLIIVVMALDHANDFIARMHPPPEMWSAPTVAPPDTLAFLTRFVTHFAAPGFFFLMGAGMLLLAEARRGLGWSEWAIVRHLALRGGLLIVLQLLVENPAWRIGDSPTFTPEVFFSYFGVLYGLGASMIVGSALLRLRPAMLLGLGVAAELATELVITWVRQAGVVPAPLVQLLIVPGRAAGFTVYYPLLPWLGVALCGMAFGGLLVRDPPRAYRHAAIIGALLLAVFLALRLAGGFGNLQPPVAPSWIAFLNVVKYPPSMVFLALTLGIDLLLLALLARADQRPTTNDQRPMTTDRQPPTTDQVPITNHQPQATPYAVHRLIHLWLAALAVFGRSPLFFYIAHLYLYGLIGLALGSRGTGIPRMYPYWLLGLAILYPLCWLYGRFKQRQVSGSLWRLL